MTKYVSISEQTAIDLLGLLDAIANHSVEIGETFPGAYPELVATVSMVRSNLRHAVMRDVGERTV